MKLFRADRLTELAAALATRGYRVIAPIRQGRIVRLAQWRPGAAIETAGISANSVKDFLFPRSEIIDRYSLNGGDFVQEEVSPEGIKTAESDRQVTEDFAALHLRIGIDSLKEIINDGLTVKHLRF